MVKKKEYRIFKIIIVLRKLNYFQLVHVEEKPPLVPKLLDKEFGKILLPLRNEFYQKL